MALVTLFRWSLLWTDSAVESVFTNIRTFSLLSTRKVNENFLFQVVYGNARVVLKRNSSEVLTVFTDTIEENWHFLVESYDFLKLLLD